MWLLTHRPRKGNGADLVTGVESVSGMVMRYCGVFPYWFAVQGV